MAAPEPGGSSSLASLSRSWRGRIELRRAALERVFRKGGPIELEHLDSTDSPLAVDYLYGDRHRELHHHGMG
jgi:hypothetical protein